MSPPQPPESELWSSELGRALLSGDVTRIQPREELVLLRKVVGSAARADRDLRPLFRALAPRDPLALAELAAGPRVHPHPRVVEAALAVAAALEPVLGAAGTYRRLVQIHPKSAGAVLKIASDRHPTASWLVSLSDQEPEFPGLIHLRATRTHPQFPRICDAHLEAGHREAVIQVVPECTHGEPVAALLRHEAIEGAVRAVAAALEVHPLSRLVPWIAATWGPDLDAFFVQVVPHLRSRAAARALGAGGDWPRTAALLARVLPGMRHVDADPSQGGAAGSR